MFFALEPAIVSSRCPLLPAEVARDFLPQVCMPVPQHSAWIPLQIDLAEFANAAGEVNMHELERALTACVDAGDRAHDQTEWREPQLEYDSWLNRRLAIALRGWGDLVVRRGHEPTSLKTLRLLEQLAEWACEIVHRRSQQMALQSHWCPALDEAGALVMEKQRAGLFGRRWKKAIQQVAVRHRNLTTISPWDVFPRQKQAEMAFADLLPITRFADSLSFQCDVQISHWNVNDFNSFRERVAAIVRCNSGAGLVAKQL